MWRLTGQSIDCQGVGVSYALGVGRNRPSVGILLWPPGYLEEPARGSGSAPPVAVAEMDEVESAGHAAEVTGSEDDLSQGRELVVVDVEVEVVSLDDRG
jgi:hypothetical protein